MSSNPTMEKTAEAIAERPSLDHIHTNRDVISEFVEENQDEDFELPSWDAPVFPEVGDEFSRSDVVDFFVVGNALNFCFNNPETGEKFEATRNGMTFDGVFGMWLCLYTEQTERELDLLDADTLQEVNREDFDRVFEPSNGVEMPLANERVAFLNDVGEGMEAVDGSFGNLIEAGTVSLFGDDGFVSRLIDATGDAYSDSRTYKGVEIPFNKRAQLAAMMLYGFFNGDVYFTVDDPTQFTIPADYGVPNTLRSLGFIEYDDELSELVDNQTELDENSQYEVEIRLATVAMGEILEEEFNKVCNDDITIPRLDYFLWSLRRDTEHPEHLTVTTAY